MVYLKCTCGVIANGMLLTSLKVVKKISAEDVKITFVFAFVVVNDQVCNLFVELFRLKGKLCALGIDFCEELVEFVKFFVILFILNFITGHGSWPMHAIQEHFFIHGKLFGV